MNKPKDNNMTTQNTSHSSRSHHHGGHHRHHKDDASRFKNDGLNSIVMRKRLKKIGLAAMIMIAIVMFIAVIVVYTL